MIMMHAPVSLRRLIHEVSLTAVATSNNKEPVVTNEVGDEVQEAQNVHTEL